MHTHSGELSRSDRDRILARIRSGIGPLTAARGAGITPQQLRKALQSSATFEEEVKTAEAEVAEELETVLFEQAKSGDYRALERWLTTRAPERWAPKADVTVDIIHSIKELPLADRLPRLESLLRDRLLALPIGDVIDAEVIEE